MTGRPTTSSARAPMLEGKWASQDVFDGLAKGKVKMGPYVNMPDDVKKMAEDTEAAIKSGKLDPFKCPVDRAGRQGGGMQGRRPALERAGRRHELLCPGHRGHDSQIRVSAGERQCGREKSRPFALEQCAHATLAELSFDATRMRDHQRPKSLASGDCHVASVAQAELGGDGAVGTNPEQLFAAGDRLISRRPEVRCRQGKPRSISPDTTVTATVEIGPREDPQGFGIHVALAIHVPGVEKSVAESLVQKAHIVCPYSHATKGSLDVRLSVV